MVNKFKIKTKKVLSIILLSTMLVSNIGTSVSAMSVSNNDLSTQTEVNVANVSNVDVQDSDLDEDLAASPEQVTISENETEEEKEYVTPEWNGKYSVFEYGYILTSDGHLFKPVQQTYSTDTPKDINGRVINATTLGGKFYEPLPNVHFTDYLLCTSCTYLYAGEDVYKITNGSAPILMNFKKSDIKYTDPIRNAVLTDTTSAQYYTIPKKPIISSIYASYLYSTGYQSYITEGIDHTTVRLDGNGISGNSKIINIAVSYGYYTESSSKKSMSQTTVKIYYEDGTTKKVILSQTNRNNGSFTRSAVETGTHTLTANDFISTYYVNNGITYTSDYYIKDGQLYDAATDVLKSKEGYAYPLTYNVKDNGDVYSGDTLIGNLSHICTLNSLESDFTVDDVKDNVTKEVKCSYCGKAYELNAAELDELAKDPQYDTDSLCTGGYGKRLSLITGKVLTADTVNTPAHAYGEILIDGDKNKCGETITKYQICSKCGDKKIISTEIVEHEPADEYTIESEATCTTDGKKYKLCINCGEVIESTIIITPKTEHDFEITNSTATCTEAGTGTLTCKVCGKVYENADVDALGHDYQMEEILSGTCNQEGEVKFTCTRCGDSYTEHTEKVDHLYNDGEENPAATCTENGKKVYTCINCGETKEEKIKKLGHDYKVEIISAPTNDTNGETKYTCKRCGETHTVITQSESNYEVSAGYKTIVLTDKTNGRMYLTGTASKYIGNDQNTVPTITYTDEQYGDRQIKTIVKNDSNYGLKRIGNENFYYGIPASLSNYTLNAVVHNGNANSTTTPQATDRVSFNNEWLMTYKDNVTTAWSKHHHTYMDGVSIRTTSSIANGFTLMNGSSYTTGDIQIPNSKVISMARSSYLVFFVTEDHKLYYQSLTPYGYNILLSDDVLKVTALDDKISYLTTDGKLHFVSLPYDDGGFRSITSGFVHNSDMTKEEMELAEKRFIEYSNDITIKFKKANIDKTEFTFSDIAISQDQLVGLTTEGKLVQFNIKGSYSNYLHEDYTELSDKTFAKIYGGTDHFLAIDIDNNLYAWGNNASGQLGTGNYDNTEIPVQITNGIIVKTASAGDSISSYIDSEGKVYVWGNNNYSQLGLTKDAIANVPSPMYLCNITHIHSYTNNGIVENSLVSCDTDGVVKMTCNECGQVTEKIIPAKQHDFISPTSYDFKYYVDYRKEATQDPIITVSDTDKYYFDKNDLYLIKATMPSGTKYIALSLDKDSVIRHEDGNTSNISFGVTHYNRTSQNAGYNYIYDYSDEYHFYMDVYFAEIDTNAIDDKADITYSFTENADSVAILSKFHDEIADKYFIKSCSSDHEEVKYCKYCFAKEYDTKPATEHTISKYGDRVSEPGYILYKCASCGEIVKKDQITYSVKMNNNGKSLASAKSSSWYWKYIDQNNIFANKEDFSKALKYEEELTLPETAANVGTFTLDFGNFIPEGTDGTLQGENVLTGYTNYETGDTYQAGDTISKLSTKDGDGVIIIPQYKTSITSPHVYTYKGSTYTVSSWYLMPNKPVDDIENHRYYGTGYVTINDSDLNETFPYLIAPNTTLYMVPYSYTCIEGEDTYGAQKQKYNSNSVSNKTATVTGLLFDSYEEFKEEYPNSNIIFSIVTDNSTSKKKLEDVNFAFTVDNNVYKTKEHSQILKGSTKINGYDIYIIPSIKYAMPDYRSYGIINVSLSTTQNPDDKKYYYYIYIKEYNTNINFILKDTLNNTESVVHDKTEIPRYTKSSDSKKVLTTWSYDKDGKVDFYNTVRTYTGDIILYSQWKDIESTIDLSTNAPKYKLATEFKKDDSVSANDVVLIGNVKTGLDTVLNTETTLKLHTDNKTLQNSFTKRMKAAKQINGLNSVTNKALFISNGSNSALYVTKMTNDVEKIQNHNIVQTNSTASFMQNGNIVTGTVIKDITDNKVKMLYNNNLYAPEFVFFNKTTADTIHMDVTADTGYLYIKHDQLLNILYDASTDTLIDTEGNIVKDSATVYKEGSVFKINNDTPLAAIKLNTAAWTDKVNIDLALITDNESVLCRNDNNIYQATDYDVETLSQCYKNYLSNFTASAINLSNYAESYLLYALANNEDVLSFLKADSYTLLSFPTEKEIRKEHIYVEKYIVENVSDFFGAFYTIEMKPQLITLDINADTAYEYQNAEITAEALKEPDKSEWRLRLDNNKTQDPLTVNLISDSSDYNSGKFVDDEFYDFVKFDVDESINQKLTMHIEVDSTNNTFTKDDLNFTLKNSNGTTISEFNGENGGISITESSNVNQFIDGEHILKIVRAGQYSDDKDWYILTEEGNIWYTQWNSSYSLKPEYDENSYTNIAYSPNNYGKILQKIAANVKFKDFYAFGNGQSIMALDTKGNLWQNKYVASNSSYYNKPAGFRQITTGVEFNKFGSAISEQSSYNSSTIYGFALLDTEGNIWICSNSATFNQILNISGSNYTLSGSVNVKDNTLAEVNMSNTTDINVIQATKGIKFIDVATQINYGLQSYPHISAIDVNGDLYLSGAIDKSIGAYQNGKRVYTTQKSNKYGESYIVTGLVKFKDLYPSYLSDVKWKSIETGHFKLDTSSHNSDRLRLGYIDTNGNLYESFDDGVGYEITETNVKDGSGPIVLDNNGKIHIRKENQKWQCNSSSNIIFSDHTFTEIGDQAYMYFLTNQDEYIFNNKNLPLDTQTPNFDGYAQSYYGNPLTRLFLTDYMDIGSFGKSTAYDYFTKLGLNQYGQNKFPAIDAEEVVFKKGDTLLYHKAYDVEIDTDSLYQLEDIVVTNGNYFLLNAHPDDQTVIKITSSSVENYGEVDTLITTENEEEKQIKSETPITKNTLKLPKVTKALDGALYELKSIYDNGSLNMYSDTVALDVVSLKELKVEYTGDPVTIGKDADLNDLKYTLVYEDGKEIETDYDSLTKKPISLPITDYVNTFDEFEFENVKASVEIPGKNGIVDLSASYPESVFKGQNFDPAKVQITANWSDGTTTHPTVTENDFASLKITKIGDNEREVTVEDMTTPLIINGYYYDHLEVDYNGEAVKLNSDYDKNDLDIKVYYTANSFNKQFDPVDPDDVISATENVIGEDLKITKVGTNTFNIQLNADKTINADVDIEGIDFVNTLTAKYTGPNIYIGENYNKDDVEVLATYESTKTETVSSTDWTENSLLVEKDGINNFKASYNGITADYKVTGFKEASITAQYNGSDIQIGKDYKKSDVTVTVIYTDSSTRTLKDNEWTESSLKVTTVGPNVYEAVYKPDENLSFTDNYTVIGFEEGCHLEAKYTGKDIYVSEKYNKKDVIVTKIYNSGKTEVLSDDEWTESSLIVTKTGENIFTAKTKDLETSYVVTGYKIENITAEYKGNNIPIGEDYNKKDVIVTIHYTNGTSEKIPDNEWKESSLTVTKIGDNDFTALYKKDSEEYTADYKIIGIDKINRIEAHYTGEEIFITEKYKKSDVKITVIYQSGEKKELSDNEWNESSLIVTKTGDNHFTATYKTFETNYTVPGISISKITAKYTGKDIEIDSKYSKNDVNVTVIYTNGKTKTLTSSEWKESELIVTKAGKNKFTASYTERNKVYTADFIVKGKAPIVKPEDPSTPIQNTVYAPIINIVKTGDLGYGIIGFAFIIIGISVIIIKKRKLNKKH